VKQILIKILMVSVIGSWMSAQTEVSGIISSNTTWSSSNSPYNIVGDIQLGYGYTLIIEAGVIVNGNGNNLISFGDIIAIGSNTEKIVFNDVNIGGGNNTLYEPYKIDLQYCVINGGSVGASGYGSIKLTDSEIYFIPYIYLWYPIDDCYFERNIFFASGRIDVGTSGTVKVYIKNNYFNNPTHDTVSETGYAVENWASYNTSETIVQYNTFINTDRVAVSLPNGYDSAAMTATYNYWGTTDEEIIKYMIHDKNDDLSSASTISYTNYLSYPNSDTPTLTHHPLWYVSNNGDDSNNG